VAKIVAHNMRVLALSTGTLKEGPAAGFSGILAVPIGRKNGAGLLPFGVVGPFLISSIKGGDLFLSKIAGIYGYSKAELIRQ
jgi:hypothetical protein